MMHYFKEYNKFALGWIVILGIFAWFIQTQQLLNSDVSWDLQITQRFLAGGNYAHDFFDLNPPLILYLYAPCIFLMKLFSISTAVALRLYVFILSFVSLWIASRLVRPSSGIFESMHPVLMANTILVSLALVFFLLPMMEFGQREHLLVIFTVPYFLLLIHRLNKKSVTLLSAIGVGCFAFMGFALKPFFLVAFGLIELFVMMNTRHIWSWRRAEVFTILVLVCLYLLLIMRVHSDYVLMVLPVAMRFYYLGFRAHWSLLLGNFLVLFCLISIIGYLWQYKKHPNSSASTVFFFATVAFFLVYLMQQTDWYYHILPAISMALLLTSIFYIPFLIAHATQIFRCVLVFTVCYCVPSSFIWMKYLDGVQYKNNQQALMTFLHEHAYGSPVYFLSADSRDVYPVVDNAGSIYSSRFLHLFWMPGVVKDSYAVDKSLNTAPAKHDEAWLIDTISEEIETKKPKYIFVDVREHKPHYSFYSFEYLPYFLKNDHFKVAWRPYHYFGRIQSHDRYWHTLMWSLYRAPDRSTIDPRLMDEDAVVLTGQGEKQVAYYVQNHALLLKNNLVLHTQVQLTPKEVSQLPQAYGKVIATQDNQVMVKQIINRAIQFPSYQYEIYEREERPHHRSEKAGAS